MVTVMKMKFKYTLDDKRYHTFNYYLKTKYQTKVAKISLNANFTCPNRDGKVSRGGCLFCSDSGSGDFAGNPSDDLKVQFKKVSEMMSVINGLIVNILLTFKQIVIHMDRLRN